MIWRVFVLGLAGFMLSACANELSPSVSLAQTAALPVAAAPGADDAAPVPGRMPKKTMADRMLAAIALERVTGLVPDPGKLLP